MMEQRTPEWFAARCGKSQPAALLTSWPEPSLAMQQADRTTWPS